MIKMEWNEDSYSNYIQLFRPCFEVIVNHQQVVFHHHTLLHDIVKEKQQPPSKRKSEEKRERTDNVVTKCNKIRIESF